MSSNNPYDSSSNTFNRVMGTAMLGGAGFGIYKAVNDAEGFQNSMTKVLNAVAPVSAADTSNIRKNQISDARGRMLAMEAHSTNRREILDRVKTRKTDANIAAGTWGHHRIDSSELDASVKEMGKEFRFSGLHDVKDLSGTSIGSEFTQALNKLGLQVQGDPTFKGTTGVFKVLEGGRESTIEIPFAAQDALTDAWISKKGDAEFITHLRAAPSLNKDGKLVQTIRGHNESLLEMLRSPEKIAHQAMSDKDLLKDLAHLTNGKIKDIEVLKRAIHAGTASTVLASVSQTQLLKRALGTDWLTEQNWVVATGMSQKAGQSGYVKLDQYALGHLNSSMPGAKNNVIGVDAANQDMANIKYQGKTYSDIFSYPQELRDDLIKGDTSRIQLPYKGKMITKANIHEVDNATTRRQFESILNGGLGFTLSQAQTAEYTMAIRDAATVKQVEAAKSEKGLLYLDENIGARPMNGVKAENLEKFRLRPTVLDKKLVGDTAATGPQKAMRDMFMGDKKGMVNMFGLVNPVGKEEYLGIAEEVYSNMKAFQPVQWSVSKLADGGLEDRSMVKIDYVDKAGKRIKTDRRLSEIFTDKLLRDELKDSKNMNIRIGRNNILGLNETGGEVWNNESLASTLGKGGQNVYSKGENLHINKNDFMHMLRDNADTVTLSDGSVVPRDPNAPMKFYGQIEGRVTKAAMLQQRARGVVYGRIENEAKGLAHAAGIAPGLEMFVHKDMYGKILPQMANGQTIMQKGSPEMLQFMQESIMGHLMAYGDEKVSLSGDLAGRFSRYLGGDPKTKTLNLTEQLLEGNMQWTQELGGKKGLGAQIADTAAVLGAMKEHTFKAGGALTLDDSLNLKLGASQMADAWNRATSSGAEDLFKKLHNGEEVTKEAARAHAWGMVSGVVPQEIGAMTQGTGFNAMKIGFRDMHYFLDKTGILEEFAYQNTTNSTKITSEMGLMAMSLGGDEQFQSALKAHEERIGEKIKRYNPEELGEMLGKFGGSTFTSDMKHPGAFKGTFLNADVNKNGFLLNAGDRDIFIGSGDLFGKSYFLPKTGKVTVEDTAMRTAAFINSTFMRGKVDAGELEKFTYSMAAEMTSAKQGMLATAGMAVDYAMYSKHVVDKNLLHSDYMKFQGEFGGEVSNLVGNATKVSSKDVEKMLHQQLSDSLNIAKENNRSIMGELQTGFGEGNFFEKYKTHIEGIANADDAKSVAKLITEDQVRVSERIHKEAKMFAEAGQNATKSQYESIRKLMSQDALSGLMVRYPAIYGSSYTAGTLLTDNTMSEKMMAPGRIALKNLFGDFDGDASMLKMVFGKTGRLQTQKLIDQTQRHTAEIIDAFKNSTKSGAMSLVMPQGERTTAILGKEMSEEVAEQLLRNAPVDSALAAYYTKSLTGALNIKAQGVKGYMDDLVSNKGLSEVELSKVHAFFSTIPSLFTEQKAISSKQAERILGLKGGQMENVTELIGSITSKKMLESIRAMEGDVHPLITMALAGGSHKAQFAEDEVKLIKNIADLNLNMRTLKDDEFKEIYSFLNKGGTEAEAQLAKYKAMVQTNVPFLNTAEGQKLKFAEGTGIIDIIGQSMDSAKKGGPGFSSESLGSYLTSVLNARKSDDPEALKDLLMKQIYGTNHRFSQASEMLTPEAFAKDAKRSFSGRTVRGWNELKKLGNWMTEEGKMGGRMGGLAAAVLGGFTALNLLSGGDGTPQTPNDLPSVNNPSFSAPRSNGMMARRTMSPTASYNSSVSLLTDNRTPYSMASGSVQNMLGVSSVSVSDGTNPYAADMHRYTN